MEQNRRLFNETRLYNSRYKKDRDWVISTELIHEKK